MFPSTELVLNRRTLLFGSAAIVVKSAAGRPGAAQNLAGSGAPIGPESTTVPTTVFSGMNMVVGAAVSEDLALDSGRGMCAIHNLAVYEVAVHADIPEQALILLDTLDLVASALPANGVGELGSEVSPPLWPTPPACGCARTRWSSTI